MPHHKPNKPEAPPPAENTVPAGLYLVSTPVGNLGDITVRALDTLKACDAVACEDTRVTGRLLTHFGIRKPMLPCHDHNETDIGAKIAGMVAGGKAVALTSDAGTPLVSDPGFRVVHACLDHGLPVIPVPGASALLPALQLSGLPCARFAFAGFMPPKSAARKTALAELSTWQGSLVFYESASRLLSFLTDCRAVLGPCRGAVVREITKKFEETKRGTLDELIAYYEQAGAPKGELVVVLERIAQDAPAEDIDGLIAAALETMSLKTAVASVAARTGASRTMIYERAIQLRAKDRGDE